MFNEIVDNPIVAGLVEPSIPPQIWDFNTSLGDTIKEKYKSLAAQIESVTNLLLESGATGQYWLFASPEVCSIIETDLSFKMSSEKEWVVNECVNNCGTFYKWRVLKGDLLSKYFLYVGVGNKCTFIEFYNFII